MCTLNVLNGGRDFLWLVPDVMNLCCCSCCLSRVHGHRHADTVQHDMTRLTGHMIISEKRVLKAMRCNMLHLIRYRTPQGLKSEVRMLPSLTEILHSNVNLKKPFMCLLEMFYHFVSIILIFPVNVLKFDLASIL